MKKSLLKVSHINGETFRFPCQIIDINQPVVVVNTLLSEQSVPILFQIKHSQINTLFDLTNVAPYEVWYIDEGKLFTGKSFSLNLGNTPFLIQTQSKHIVLIPYGFDLSYQIKSNILDCNTTL